MLSMVSANQFTNIVAIPLITVAYAVFLCIDHNRNPNIADIKHEIQDIQNSGGVDGLVFGGSNALYGLSAESLSYYTGMKWYNGSMANEAVIGTRIIQDLSARIDRAKVKYFVYSSVLPYWGQTSWTLDQKVIGEGIKPTRSIGAYIKKGGNIDYRSRMEIRNGFGDIVFDRIKCDFNGDSHVDLRAKKWALSGVESLVDKAISFASIFPNASILIVLPSGYYGGLSFDDSIFDEAVRTKFYGVLGGLSGKYFKNSMVKVIVQPPYASITQVCDSPWHANENGRTWRTLNLIEFMH